MIVRAVMLALAVSLGACTWFDAGPPDRSCRTDRDCFRAQGEACNQTAHVCEVLDAGVDAPPLDATVAP